MIRIDAVWLATQPLDMRAGTDSALARVVAVFGAAHPHTAYLFANKRANRMKVLLKTQALSLDHLNDLELEVCLKASSGFLILHVLRHLDFEKIYRCVRLN